MTDKEIERIKGPARDVLMLAQGLWAGPGATLVSIASQRHGPLTNRDMTMLELGWCSGVAAAVAYGAHQVKAAKKRSVKHENHRN